LFFCSSHAYFFMPLFFRNPKSKSKSLKLKGTLIGVIVKDKIVISLPTKSLSFGKFFKKHFIFCIVATFVFGVFFAPVIRLCAVALYNSIPGLPHIPKVTENVPVLVENKVPESIWTVIQDKLYDFFDSPIAIFHLGVPVTVPVFLDFFSGGSATVICLSGCGLAIAAAVFLRYYYQSSNKDNKLAHNAALSAKVDKLHKSEEGPPESFVAYWSSKFRDPAYIEKIFREWEKWR